MIFELHKRIDDYVQRNPELARNFRFDVKYLPPIFRNFAGEVISTQKLPEWITDKGAFNGNSALDKLSALETAKFCGNAMEVMGAVYGKVRDSVKISYVPTPFEILCEVREAQAKQLGIVELTRERK